MRSAIFDLDGTLVDTSADLLAAANAVFESWSMGSPLGEGDEIIAFGGGRAMLRAGLMRLGHPVDEDKLSAGYQPLLSHYRDNIDHFSRVYPGVEGALDNLRRAGWKLGVCTNKPQALADILLSKLGLAAYFPVVLGADALAVRKPDPLHLTETIARLGGAAGRGVLIGDTITDHSTARAAGMPSVLVTFGPNAAACRALVPDALLDNFAALPHILDRLMPA
jgi:phosphoglycolate phosphatase